MAKTLITTPFPTREDIIRTYGISRKRARELDAMIEEVMAENDRREARAKARKRLSRQAVRKGNIPGQKSR